MQQFDYTFIFHDVGEFGGRIQFENLRSRSCSKLYLTLHDTQLIYGASVLRGVLADMVDVAIAAYVTDRFVLRGDDERATIRVVIPVRYPEITGSEKLLSQLCETLGWYTGDHWHFEVTSRQSYGREAEAQTPLFVEREPDNETALWSGGLDSLGGLYNRKLIDSAKNFTLVGVGDNTNTQHLQKQLWSKVRKEIPGLRLVQVNWNTETFDNLLRNPRARSRGFAFLILGAVAALIQGQSVLNVYENGIGALNLPYRSSEIGLDHSRAVHPLSFVRMQRLISAWIGQPFVIENPFLFKTKAEVIERIASSNLKKLIFETSTCDSVQRQSGERRQCGQCTSCLLRRQALKTIGLQDETPYAILENYQIGQPIKEKEGSHLRVMLNQVNRINTLTREPDPWRAMEREYSDLTAVADWITPPYSNILNSRNQLINLYQRYTKEWQSVWESLTPGMLTDPEVQYWRSKLTIR